MAAAGASGVGVDVSAATAAACSTTGRGATARDVPLAQADAVNLPFGSGVFDVAFSANGAVSFVADVAALFTRRSRESFAQAGGGCSASPTRSDGRFPDDPGAGRPDA